MTEKLNSELETEQNSVSLPSASEHHADEKIRKNKIEVLASEGEVKKERRIDRTLEIMQENSERASALAAERTAVFEYGSEYRKMLIARENKRAAEEKARLEAEERKAEAVRETERNVEIEAFKERERAELERRTKQTQTILEELNKEKLREESVCAVAEESCTAKSEAPETEIKEAETEKTEKKRDTDQTFKISTEETERIILNIDPNKITMGLDCPSGENIIHIPSLYCAPQNASCNSNSEMNSTNRTEIESQNTGYGGLYSKASNEPVGNLYYGGVYTPPNESFYRDYYNDANELYDKELIDEYQKFLSDREAVQSDIAFGAPDDFGALDDYEKALEEKHFSKYDGVDTEREHADISIGMDTSDPQGEDINIFAKTELSRRLGAYHKQESLLKSKLKKIDSKKNNLSYAESVRLTVEKIGMHKEIVEIAIEALRACVYAQSRVNISKHKKFLVKEIFAYNFAVREYETLTGKQLERISPQIADDVIEGKICDPIPNVYYVDDGHHRPENIIHYEPHISNETTYSDGTSVDSVDPELSDDSVYDDAEAREKEKIFEKEYSKRVSEIRRISERDVLLIALRNEYKLSRYETEYHMLQHTFSVNNRQKVKMMRKLDKKITKIRSNLRRSIKLERDDNRRYYYLLTVDPMKERVSRDARRDVLDALKLRLEILLSERAEINERIIALYGGSDKNLRNLKIERKAAGVRRKYTKVMYRRQQRLAAKVQRMKAPSDLKEKFFELLNKKIEKVSILEEKIYRLKRGKCKGKALRELVRDVKNVRRAIKYVDTDIKYVMKKLRRHQQRYEDDRSWAITLIVFSAVAVALVVGWYFYGDLVKAYLYDIWTRIKARF